MSRFFILFLLLFSALQAEQETFPFIGVTISSHTVNLKPSATIAPNKPKNPKFVKRNSVGVQYGVQTQEFRTTFTAEANSDFQSVDVEVDYIFMDSLLGTSKVRPYVGATLGYMRYDDVIIKNFNSNRISNDLAHDRNTTIKNRDGYYGLNIGMLFYLSDNIDIDVSSHYFLMDRLEPLDTMYGIKASLHYFY